jgi:hypothetical protein
MRTRAVLGIPFFIFYECRLSILTPRVGAINDDVQDELRRRWLAACGANIFDGQPLISRTQLLGNL